MHPQTINSIKQVSNYVQLPPLIGGMKANTDKLPKNNLPTISNGTVQENAEKAIKNVIYDSYGRMTTIPKTNLIAVV